MGQLKLNVYATAHFKRSSSSSRRGLYGRSQVPGSGLGGGGGGSRSGSRSRSASRGGAGSTRKLTITDALSYLNEVKCTFQDQMEKYNMLLDIMTDFKNQRIDTAGVVAKVKDLFKGHPNLLLGFNTFLSEAHKITLNDESPPTKSADQFEKSTSSQESTSCERVKERLRSPADYLSSLTHFNHYINEKITRKELQLQVAGVLGKYPDLMEGFDEFIERTERVVGLLGDDSEGNEGHTNSKSVKEEKREQKSKTKASLQDALSFLKKLKERFGNDDHTYKSFLSIIKSNKMERKSTYEVHYEVAKFLNDHPDLLDEFTKFLPDN